MNIEQRYTSVAFTIHVSIIKKNNNFSPLTYTLKFKVFQKLHFNTKKFDHVSIKMCGDKVNINITAYNNIGLGSI